MLAGKMMDFPLTLTHLFERARAYFPDTEIVSRAPSGAIERTTYGAMLKRACRLGNALARLGVKKGDRVATLAWNHSRHLEAYIMVPTMGAILHTLNLRLHPSELAYVARHAEDSVVIVDQCLLPLLAQALPHLPELQHVIVIGDGTALPEVAKERKLLDYETLLAAESDTFALPALDEHDPCGICYTSGTTGNPKGVVYSQRSMVLHTLGVCLADTLGIAEADTVLAGRPHVPRERLGPPLRVPDDRREGGLPGPKLDPTSILDLIHEERVTLAAGVPTIWIGILALLDQNPKKWDPSAIRTMVIGGSAAPPAMIEGFKKRHGLDVLHAWGMTEMSPIGSVARVKQKFAKADDSVKLACKATQGCAVPLVETRHVADDGRILPWDGETMGELEVRGPWVAASYLGGDGADRFTKDGWFKTGDVVTIDAEGYLRICDRSKDVIKSGGEWISSVALENALMSHPAVLEAAVFAGRHAKWDERPIAAIVLKKGEKATEGELSRHIEGSFAKFWLPDAYVFVDQIPRTSTGKFYKLKLREDYGDLLMKR